MKTVHTIGKRIVYIAGPYRGPDAWAIHLNITRAEAASLKVWRAGGVALCPHANTAHFQSAAPDSVWLSGDIELMLRSDAVLMVEGWEKSSGARAELDSAIEYNIPVFYEAEFDRLVAWLNETAQPVPHGRYFEK